MKKWLILLVLAQVGCASKTTPAQVLLTSGCPEKADCNLQVIPNKSLQIIAETPLKYELSDNPDTNVIIYKSRKKAKGNAQDADYREEVIFECKAKTKRLQLTGAQLQNAKMLFGRFCYCPGQTGYYRVSKGDLSIDGPNVKLDFSVTEVPQITREISFTLP